MPARDSAYNLSVFATDCQHCICGKFPTRASRQRNWRIQATESDELAHRRIVAQVSRDRWHPHCQKYRCRLVEVSAGRLEVFPRHPVCIDIDHVFLHRSRLQNANRIHLQSTPLRLQINAPVRRDSVSVFVPQILPDHSVRLARIENANLSCRVKPIEHVTTQTQFQP